MYTSDKFIIHIKDECCSFKKAMELVQRVIEQGELSDNGRHKFCFLTTFGNPVKYAVSARGNKNTTTFRIYEHRV